ncbi:MAG: alternate-type signal peptide domain-containing protein [Bifidobacteriaceae bacterium]|jgi:alternate signal-mediated exported protein|nr:alternate-type signal peptide domain-containing protein [Bifidobacteriaceae bacterium]
MTINPTTERERRSRRFKGLVAGAAGIALLLGGATFAMWSDSEEADVDKIQHGILDVADATAVSGIYDLRRDANTSGNPKSGSMTVEDAVKINPTSFKAVPGDVLEVVLPVNVTATGDNMEYTLQLTAGEEFVKDADWTAKVYVFNEGGTKIVDGTVVDLSETAFQETGALIVSGIKLTSKHTVAVVVELPGGNFSAQERVTGSVVSESDNTATDLLALDSLIVTATQTNPYAPVG